jgi:hypothetical protein
MKHTVQECALILRQLSPERGVAETNLPIKSLEELYDFCLTMKEPRLLERIIIAGEDARGRKRLLTFTFQSISEPK